VLNRAGRSEDAKALSSRIEGIDARWELESFSVQYEALRATMPPGADRTSRMEVQLLVPHRLARTHQWTRDDIWAGWKSGEDGKRMFALGLIEANPRLADVRVLVDGIRASRSAFEQYHALVAAAGAKLGGEEAKAVRAAVEAEVRGDPRPDGSEPGIKPGSDRMTLARRLLQGEVHPN
jgi:hypothetical protein